MWQLRITNAAKEWIEVGNLEVEGRDGDAPGLFLEFCVETGEWGTDEEAFRVFHSTSKRARCVIKRT